MKKIIFLMVGFFLLVSAGAQAANIEFKGGITYNSFAGDILISNQTTSWKEKDEIYNGHGFFVEGLYPVKERIYIGLGFEYVLPEYNDNLDMVLSGPYGKISFNIMENVNINLGVASYMFRERYDAPIGMIDFAKGSGYLFGIDYKAAFKEDFSITFSLDYRKALLGFTDYVDSIYDQIHGEDYNYLGDLSGLRLGIALNY